MLHDAPSRRRIFGAGVWNIVFVSACLAVASAGCTVKPGGDTRLPGGGVDSNVGVDAAYCGSQSDRETCRALPGCYWLTTVCDAGRIASACVPNRSSPDSVLSCRRDGGGPNEPTDTSDGCPRQRSCESDTGFDAAGDAGSDGGGPGDTTGDGRVDVDDVGMDASDGSSRCTIHGTPSRCRRAKGCEWWQGTCGSVVVREECVATSEPPPDMTCTPVPPKKCHEATSESGCSAVSCTWVEKGCGSSSTKSIEIEACLPDGSCKRDADCPTGHRCEALWLDPCLNRACGSCGGRAKRCVHDSLLSP